MRRALRYLRRTVAILVLIVAFVVFALMIISRTPEFHRFLRDKVVAFANSTYRGQLSIGRVEGSILGGLRLQQVVLTYQGKPIASIPQLSLDYSLAPLTWHTLHVRLLIESPTIDAVQESDGKWNLLDALTSRVPAPPPKTPATRSLTISVDSLQIRSGEVSVTPAVNAPAYRIANLDLDSTARLPSAGMVVNLRRLTANVMAPKMPAVYTAVALEYNAVASPAKVKLTDLEMRTQRSTVSVAGLATLAQPPSVDLKLSLPRLSAADVSQISASSPLKSDIAGTITLRGPENALHSVVALETAGARLDGTADADATQKRFAASMKVAGADLQKIMRINGAAGVLDATIDTHGTASDLSAAIADIRLHGRKLVFRQYDLGTLDLTMNAANKSARVQLTDTAPAGYLTANGTANLVSTPAYHLELTARHLNVAKTAAKATPTDLNVQALIDGRGVTPATANTSIQIRVNRSQLAQVTLDRGLIDARLANNRADIARVHFEAAQSTLDVHGSAGLAATAPANISYTVHSRNVKGLMAVAKRSGTGRLDINGRLTGQRSALRTAGNITFDALQTSGYSVQHAFTQYDVGITGPAAQSGKLNLTMTGLKGGAELRSFSLALGAMPGTPRTVDLTIKAQDSAGRNDLLATHFIYRPPSINGRITQINLGLPSGDWRLAAPADYVQSPRGLSLSRLQLQSGARELLLEGTIARQGAQKFSAVLNRFDVAALQPLAPSLHDLRGALSMNLQVAGTASAPTIDFAAKAAGLAVNKQAIGELDASMNYAGERAALNAILRQNPTDHLTAAGALPMNVSWANGVKAKIGDRLDLTVNSAHLNLAQVGTLFPDKLQNFQGALAINLRVQGTLKRPEPAGSIRISGVQGEIVPLGVKISEMHTAIALDPREVRIETLEAHAGKGTFTGNGSVTLAQYAPAALGIDLKFDNWPAIDTQEYAATIAGNIAARGSVSQPRVAGWVEVLHGTIQPDIGFLSASSNLAPDETIMVIQPGQRVPMPSATNAGPAPAPPPPPKAQPSTFQNLAMKVAVIIHRNTWIRHPDAAIELEGNLDVNKDRGGPVRVAGELHTVRGWMNYYHREFTVKTGVIDFTGGQKIDPGLDIDTQYVVTNYTVDILVGGTASKPTLQLRSQPELAQADILSLLLFGKTTDALGQGQRASLQQQATKMATGVAAKQIGQAVASSMGLQSAGIQFNDTSTTGPSVGVGRYLGENTYVSAAQPVGGKTGRQVSVQYFLRRWLSVTTSTSSDGSHEIDLSLVKNY